jgi:hypothetical protein
MLIKPLDTISSLPIVTSNSLSDSSLVGGLESKEFLETFGRLLMLPIIYHERSNKYNKRNHDRLVGISKDCISHSWSLCNCNYAKYIRTNDLKYPLVVIETKKGSN